MEIFFEEVKRQLRLKRLLIYLVISIMLGILWACFIIFNASEGFMQTGCYKGYSGLEQIKAAAKDREPTEGIMTEEGFQKGWDIFLKALDGRDESKIVVSNDLLEYAVYSDQIAIQAVVLNQLEGGSVTRLSDIPRDSGVNYYKNEDTYYNKYIDKNSHNEAEKQCALSIWNGVSKPYTYYTGFKQWSEGTEHIAILSFVLMVMAGIFASSMIAQDKESGIDEIITSTGGGRRMMTVAKIFIPQIMAALIYIAGIGIYMIMLRSIFPPDALKTSLQVSDRSIFPYTVGGMLLRMCGLSFLGILSVAAFSTWVSSVTCKASRAMQICVIVPICALILESFINIRSGIFSVVKAFIPGGTLFSYMSAVYLNSFSATSILGRAFPITIVLVVACLIVFIISMALAAFNYVRR